MTRADSCGTWQKGGMNTMDRKSAVRFLLKKPYKFGHMVGFNKLTELHNGWMVKMLDIEGPDMTLQGHRG